MKKAILVLFVLGYISMNGYAQKVYKKDNKVYLECTVATGMPAGSITTTAKCVDGAASNSTFRGGSSLNIYAEENDKIFEKLEIDMSDMAKPGEPTTFTMDWVTAYDVCKAKNTSGVTGWRLPTQRELMLMYIFRVPLGSMTNNFFDSDYYWSSSEKYGNTSWNILFSAGNTGTNDKSGKSYRVRCVREVTP